jgi:hypothetical protein
MRTTLVRKTAVPRRDMTPSGTLDRIRGPHSPGATRGLGWSTNRCMSQYAVTTPSADPMVNSTAIVTRLAPAAAAAMPRTAVEIRLTTRVVATYC